MGQTTSSSGDGSAINLGTLQGEIQKQAAILREVATLTYDDFIKAVDEVNRISLRFTDTNGKYLFFKVKPGSDSTLLWKGTVRVDCIKMDKSDNIESVRQLNIKQFLQLRKVISCQSGASASGGLVSPSGLGHDEASSCNITASMILNSVETECHGSSLDECCICMERKPDISLPCAHNYCLPCIEQWNVSHKTCPVCREKLENTEDSWVISEKPDTAEMTAEIQKCLIELSKNHDS